MKVFFNDIYDVENFISENNSFEFILLEFSTKWCFSCKKLKKVIENIKKNRDDLLILEMDAEESFRISQNPKFSVLSVPTIFIFKKGHFVKKIEGYVEPSSLEKILN